MDTHSITKEKIGGKENPLYKIIHNIPFFLVICEKEMVLESTMNAVRDLGYLGYLGIGTQGYASTSTIRTLISYAEEIHARFCVFVIHDYDIDGIKIMLDMKRYFFCESAGLNPELMDITGLDFDTMKQKYRGSTGEAKPKMIKGAYTLINELYDSEIIDETEKEEYEDWIKGCTKGRLELQTLTGKRLEEDMNLNPARDFADYIAYKLEEFDRIWDINRYKKVKSISPESYYNFYFNEPDFIEEITEEIKEKISNKIQELLESKNLSTTYEWRNLVSEKYTSLEEYGFMQKTIRNIRRLMIIYGRIKAIRVRRKHKKYTGSLKDVPKVIEKEESKFYSLFRKNNRFLRKRSERLNSLRNRLFLRLPEAKEIKEKLDFLNESVDKALKELEIENENQE
jgi:hypothetical protein